MTPDRAAKPFPWRCPKCLKREVRPGSLAEYTAHVKHDGRVHEVTVHDLAVARCRACGEISFTLETDDQINRALRAQLGLLQPQQIKELRGRRFKQQELADLLGIAPETISRWENGAVIQSRAMDNLVRLFFSVPEVERALRNPVRLSCATPRPRLSRKSRRAS
jgi:putative zinc finger/helix-turn-helix YgiT family protein